MKTIIDILWTMLLGIIAAAVLFMGLDVLSIIDIDRWIK